MNFRTIIPIQKESNNLINYHSKIVLIGSCFSENIGNKLNYYKFQSTTNPFGILFNPKAIENLILNAIHQKQYVNDDLFFYNERWHCFDAHSNLSSPDKNKLLNNLNTGIALTHTLIKNASHIIITLGTAWVYKYIESNKFVANCHKVPQKFFSKELLTADEVLTCLKNISDLVRSVNKEANIIITVSPVRHIKDGFIENQQSKAHLISAIHNLIKNNNHLVYFPSYEIMMDELRDYRFYNEDMIHPNLTAINYIWERFSDSWFMKQTEDVMRVVDSIQKGLSHRPFNPNSEQHKAFLKKLETKKEMLMKTFPFMSF